MSSKNPQPPIFSTKNPPPDSCQNLGGAWQIAYVEFGARVALATTSTTATAFTSKGLTWIFAELDWCETPYN